MDPTKKLDDYALDLVIAVLEDRYCWNCANYDACASEPNAVLVGRDLPCFTSNNNSQPYVNEKTFRTLSK